MKPVITITHRREYAEIVAGILAYVFTPLPPMESPWDPTVACECLEREADAVIAEALKHTRDRERKRKIFIDAVTRAVRHAQSEFRRRAH
jgi:hypothetical protein